MKHEIIKLKEENPYIILKTYISEDEPEICAAPRPAVIVCPGGAYEFLAAREGEPVVKEFFAKGFNCFMLHYSIRPHAAFPTPLQDMSRAIIHIKEHAKEYNVDPDRIFVCGFSAGGHLAASIGTMWHTEEAKPTPDMPYGMNKPFGMILCYPFITLSGPHTHEVCTANITNGDLSQEKRDKYSPDKQVSDKTVPAYIWTTCFDDCVDVENSLYMAEALSAKKIPYELHIFQHGPHGMTLCNEETSAGGQARLIQPDAAEWISEAVRWAKQLCAAAGDETLNRGF